MSAREVGATPSGSRKGAALLRIYHVSGTRSVRPIWLCYELGLTIEVTAIDFAPAFRDTAEWRAISPAGKVPC